MFFDISRSLSHNVLSIRHPAALAGRKSFVFVGTPVATRSRMATAPSRRRWLDAGIPAAPLALLEVSVALAFLLGVALGMIL
jgi:hypothetical protein